MKKFEDEQSVSADDLLKDYNELGSLRAIGKKYGRDHSTIKAAFDRMGISYDKSKRNRVSLDEGFFARESGVMYYWVGFLLADGCVHKNYLRLTLAEKDLDHLKLFQSDLSHGGKLTKTISKTSSRNPSWKDSYCYSLAACSESIVNDVKSFGIVPRKTHNIKFPDIPDEFVKDFCRGYFDGGGGWSLHRPKSKPNHKPQVMFSVRGTHDFLKEFNKVLVHEANLPSSKLSKKISVNSGIYDLKYLGNGICSKIYRWLYSGVEGSRYLERKANKVVGFLDDDCSIILP